MLGGTGRPRQPDLLESVEDAGAWLDQALESWSGAPHRPAPGIALTAEDVQGLRDLRHGLNRLVQAPTDESSPQPGPVASLMTLPTALRLDEHGRIRAEPRGTGWRQSGVWHDVRVCGNAANLRNYRARKRAGTEQP
ncbi:CGNR zinc finger domain-containing protein [Streptomyces sp. IBSBF 3136]|uniref:CGNR zinc finger domain-containing protein n=1 Tax=Streptomyces sp. IBSBF 3136 TaxID=2903524 RepID=UPI002FDC496A